ncbi:MAG: PEP-CTERM sorting domain-containing protein [Chitinophagaceae bacterium]|nr:PEP-CTERM sorting domain-containing protein [Rubrivivax sp.]
MKMLSAAVVALAAAAPAFAQTTVTIDFDGPAGYVNSILDYYNGGTDALGQSGPNLGVSFTEAAVALANDALGPYYANSPSPIAVMFAFDSSAVMNVASGFVDRVQFFYSSPQNVLDAVNIYSGLNATGTLLASVSLFGNSQVACSGTYCRFDLTSVRFAGIGKSISFDGFAPNVLFDNVTISAVPEPGAYLLLALGLVGVAVARRRRPE